MDAGDPQDYSKKHNVETCAFCNLERNATKIEHIDHAISNNLFIGFDYVGKDMSVKFGKRVKPIEVRGHVLVGIDMDKDSLRNYILDGIQGGEAVGTCLNKKDVGYALNMLDFGDWQSERTIDNDLPF